MSSEGLVKRLETHRYANHFQIQENQTVDDLEKILSDVQPHMPLFYKAQTLLKLVERLQSTQSPDSATIPLPVAAAPKNAEPPVESKVSCVARTQVRSTMNTRSKRKLTENLPSPTNAPATVQDGRNGIKRRKSLPRSSKRIRLSPSSSPSSALYDSDSVESKSSFSDASLTLSIAAEETSTRPKKLRKIMDYEVDLGGETKKE